MDRAEKALIYGRLAEIAFNKEDFQVSLEGYRNLISYSPKDKIEDANSNFENHEINEGL